MNILTKDNWNDYCLNLDTFAKLRSWFGVSFNIWSSEVDNILLIMYVDVDRFKKYKLLLNNNNDIKKLDRFLLDKVVKEFPFLKDNNILITHSINNKRYIHNNKSQDILVHLIRLINEKCIDKEVLDSYIKDSNTYITVTSGYLTKI